jgi:hypothetical protein
MTHENSDSQAARPMATQDKVSARRRLIKGSFAAPAAMALCSGSALAAGSATCVNKLQGSAALPSQTTANTSTTGFWRVQVYKSDKTGNPKWIKGSDVVALNVGKTPFLTAFQFYKTSLGAEVSPPVAVGHITNNLAVVGNLSSSSPQEWVAVRVDMGGNIVGVQGLADQGSTSPMTATCWTSFKV